MTLGEVIKNYRTAKEMTIEQFAYVSGLSKAYISMLERNQNPSSKGRGIGPSMETMHKVAKAVGADPDQLVRIMGREAEDTAVYRVKGILPLPPTKTYPLLGNIACGLPILAEENVEDYIRADEHIRADFCLRCKGDSMINARIFDGDIVFLREQNMVENGEIAAVLIDDLDTTATLKRVRRFPDRLVLEAENPMYQPLVFWGRDMEKVRIIGKAVYFISAVL